MNGVTELSFQKSPARFPWKQEAEKQEKLVHTRAPSSRYNAI
jgi:hypothetical protein